MSLLVKVFDPERAWSLRVLAKMTRREVEAVTLIPASTLRNYERGGARPSTARVALLAFAYGCSIDDLFSESSNDQADA